MSRYPAMDVIKAGDVFMWRSDKGTTLIYVVLENDPESETITSVSYAVARKEWWMRSIKNYVDWIFLNPDYIGHCFSREEDFNEFKRECYLELLRKGAWW